MFWTEERLAKLECMWLCGIGSGAIAHALGAISRHAVMGKIDRLGLMGRKGAGYMPEASDAEIRAARDQALSKAARRNAAGTIVPVGIEDEYALIQTAFLLGRDSPRLATLACAERATAEAILERLASTGIWPAKGGPPPAWFDTNEHGESPALITDILLIAGHIEHNGEGYALTAKGLDLLAREGHIRPDPKDAAPLLRQLAKDVLAADRKRGRPPYDLDGMLITLAALHDRLEPKTIHALTHIKPARIRNAIELFEVTGAWREGEPLPTGPVDDAILPAYVRILAIIASVGAAAPRQVKEDRLLRPTNER